MKFEVLLKFEGQFEVRQKMVNFIGLSAACPRTLCRVIKDMFQNFIHNFNSERP